MMVAAGRQRRAAASDKGAPRQHLVELLHSWSVCCAAITKQEPCLTLAGHISVPFLADPL